MKQTKTPRKENFNHLFFVKKVHPSDQKPNDPYWHPVKKRT